MEEHKTQNQKCQRCKVNYDIENFNQKRNGVLLKTCKRCCEKVKESRDNNRCEHNRVRYYCKDCGGGSFCEHNRQRNTCRDCGGSSICEHNKQRNICKDCGGSSICEHNKQQSKCKHCNDPISITIKKMILHSKESDKKNNRYDQVNFIDYCFIENLIDDCEDKCYYCNCKLQYVDFTNNLATIERLDNSIGHIKGNCVIACKKCNVSKISNK